jgi:hypothetical protein
MNLVYFLALERRLAGVGRRIATVWESDGHDEHRPVFTIGRVASRLAESKLLTPDEIADARTRIEAIVDSGMRTIEQVRAKIVG